MMDSNRKRSEKGQALVVLVVAMVGLLVAAGLAIDGGTVYLERRRMQNAADAAAKEGTRALFRWQVRTDYMAYAAGEEALLSAIHTMAEANGVPDTDGVPGNAVNENVTAWYVDGLGERLTPTKPIGHPDAVEVCQGKKCIPSGADKCCGVEVKVRTRFGTSLIQLAGPDTAPAEAVAVAAYSATAGNIGPAAIWADSNNCEYSIKWSGQGNKVYGDIHSNHDIEMETADNVVSGRAEYVTSYRDDGGNSVNWVKVPETPLEPIWYVEDFAPGGRIANIVQDKHTCGVGEDDYYYHSGDFDITQATACGVHFAEGKLTLGDSDVTGEVTLVVRGEKEIDISGSNQDLKPYQHAGEVLPLAFSGYKWPTEDEQCTKQLIKMQGSGCDWEGVVYAPYGNIYISGSNNTTLSGSVIGWTVETSGSNLIFGSPAENSPAQLNWIRLIR